jgi:excisionase family DNA binding protein
VIEVASEDRVLTPAEAAAVLGVKVKDLHQMEARGQLRPIRTLGGHRRYREDAVIALRGKRDGIRAATNGASSSETMSSGQVALVFRVSRRVVVRRVREEKIAGKWTDGHRLEIPSAEVARLLQGDGSTP